jgi:hypothetical protein
MSGPSGEQCRGCYFAEPWEDESNQPDPYHCRRFPPSDPCEDGMGGHLPPTVAPDEWCGEFKPKPGATP